MGATNLQNGDEITYKKILMFISMTMITSQKCRVINENLHIRGTISVKSVATYLWSQLTYDHKRRISLTWKVSHKLRQEKWNPKLKFQTGRPPVDFIFKPVPIYIYTWSIWCSSFWTMIEFLWSLTKKIVKTNFFCHAKKSWSQERLLAPHRFSASFSANWSSTAICRRVFPPSVVMWGSQRVVDGNCGCFLIETVLGW